MNTTNRTEFDAKLETIEVRSDGRVSKIFSKIDSHIDRMDERELADKVHVSNISETLKEIKKEVRSSRTTITATTIIVGVATVLGIASFNATVLSNMVASFEFGKSAAMIINESTTRLEKLQDRIEAVQKRQPQK